MSAKIKYTWELMHGDADHYDKESIILTDENDIKFFDYVIDLNFESRDCEGLIFEKEEYDDNDEYKENEYYKKELISLFKKSKIYKNDYDYNNSNNDNILISINDYLSDINYIMSDATCDGFHYASINDIKRTEIKNKPKDKNIYVVCDNNNIVKIFKNKKKAEKFIINNNMLYIIKEIILE